MRIFVRICGKITFLSSILFSFLLQLKPIQSQLVVKSISAVPSAASSVILLLSEDPDAPREGIRRILAEFGIPLRNGLVDGSQHLPARQL